MEACGETLLNYRGVQSVQEGNCHATEVEHAGSNSAGMRRMMTRSAKRLMLIRRSC